MKILNVALGIIVMSQCLSGFSQAPVVSSLSDLNAFMQSDYHYKNDLKTKNEMIEGSPYLSEAFSSGSLIYKNTYYKDLLLRYNVYQGHFEFKSNDEILYFDPRYTAVDTVWLGNDTYIFQEYNDTRNVKRSYMHLLYDGNNGTQVLALMQITLLRPEQPKGYEDAKPARFQKKPDEIYIKTSGKVALEFKNKKSIGDIFDQKGDQLNAYAKKNKLKLKNTEDIIQLCKYYDELE